MKTKSIISSIIVLFLLAIILAGCRKEIDPPILRVEIKPTQVAYNGSATLTWQGENLASLKINGENQSSLNSGSMTLNNLIENTTYSFVAVGLDGTTISQSVSILVDKPKPELIVTVTPNTVIPYKESATVSWQGKDLASLKVNDRSELETGSISLTKLVADTTIHFVAVGLDGSNINQSVLVKVASPPVLTKADSVKMLLINKPWKLVDISSYTMDGKYIDSWTLTERDKVEIWYFYADGSRAIDKTAYGGGVYKTGPNDFSISPDGTRIAFGGSKDYANDGFGIVVTEDTHIVIVPSIMGNATTGEKTPIQVVETYKV